MIQQASGCWLLGTNPELGRLGKSLERYFRAAGERPGRVISGSGGGWGQKNRGTSRGQIGRNVLTTAIFWMYTKQGYGR